MKIVYFDYWVGGIRNFISLDAKLKDMGHETLLFHVGSFNETVKQHESISSIKCFDISFFKTKYIFKALKKIQPDVIISLNTTYVVDRILVQSCKELGIKTVFMMHGDRATGDVLNKIIKETQKQHGNFLQKLKKGTKYFSVIIPNYVLSSFKFNLPGIFKLQFLQVLADYLFNTGRALYYPLHASELLHDKCLVYANKYKTYYAKIGYPKELIHVVGNPKHDELFRKIKNISFIYEDLPLEVQALLNKKQKYAVYLEDAFVESGNMFGWTNEKRNHHLNEISEHLGKQNITLVVKAHPSSLIKNFELNTKNIILLQKIDLDNLIYHSDFCIAHISTTVHIALLFNKPVIVPKWGISKEVADYYCHHGVANEWKDLLDKPDLSLNKIKRDTYIKHNITILESTAITNIINHIIN